MRLGLRLIAAVAALPRPTAIRATAMSTRGTRSRTPLGADAAAAAISGFAFTGAAKPNSLAAVSPSAARGRSRARGAVASAASDGGSGGSKRKASSTPTSAAPAAATPASASPKRSNKRKEPPASATKKRGRSPSPPPVLAEPADWRATYDLIVELRADRTAVVDSMGAEAIAADSPAEERAFQSLISLMLSSQTKDTVNIATMRKLRAHGCTLENLRATSDETLHELIRAVGFHNNKVKFIRQTMDILHEKHGGRVPDSMEELLELPGVGPKMSLILLSIVYGKIEGISVDTHVHRICNQLGWTGDKGTKQPEQTRKAIESWMPREVWPYVNVLLVGLGQEVQTEKAKLLTKCASSSDPPRAMRLAATLGVDVAKQAKMASIELEDGWLDPLAVD